jgi:hypothetical protein
MGGFGIWHIVILAILVVVFILPISKILQRAGWNGWLSLLWLIPGVNIVMLWVFAFGSWPAIPEKSN